MSQKLIDIIVYIFESTGVQSIYLRDLLGFMIKLQQYEKDLPFKILISESGPWSLQVANLLLMLKSKDIVNLSEIGDSDSIYTIISPGLRLKSSTNNNKIRYYKKYNITENTFKNHIPWRWIVSKEFDQGHMFKYPELLDFDNMGYSEYAKS